MVFKLANDVARASLVKTCPRRESASGKEAMTLNQVVIVPSWDNYQLSAVTYGADVV